MVKALSADGADRSVMCFSATASFTAAAALAVVGAASLASARTRNALPFAAIPLLFAAQQALEGAIWLSFESDPAGLHDALTCAYAFFSHVLWPTWIPLATLLIEPEPRRRKALQAVLRIGLLLSAWLAWLIVSEGVVSKPTAHHVEYVSSSSLATLGTLCYVLSVAASLVISSQRWIRVFGALALLSFGAAYAMYAEWLVSVWCFFAALLSAVVLVQLRSARPGRRQAASGADRSDSMSMTNR